MRKLKVNHNWEKIKKVSFLLSITSGIYLTILGDLFNEIFEDIALAILVISISLVFLYYVNRKHEFTKYFFKEIPWLITIYFIISLFILSIKSIFSSAPIEDVYFNNFYVSVILLALHYVFYYFRK